MSQNCHLFFVFFSRIQKRRFPAILFNWVFNMATTKRQASRLLSAIAIAGMSFTGVASAATLDDAVEQGVERVEQAQASQQTIDSIDKDIRATERDYRALMKEIEGLNVYISQLDRQLDAQAKDLASIDKSMSQAALVERQITPLMLRMIDAVNQFVAADVPFLKEERMARVSKLNDLMGRSDVTAAEKYRKVMEVYQAEIEYGRTIESYRGELEGETPREVDFLRIGRIALVYQSLDGQELGIWNTNTNSWQPLAPEYKSKVMAGIRIAREQAAPDLIKVPVAAPMMAQQEAN